jgi:methenyltetrahydrofolate cyclohydrolase
MARFADLTVSAFLDALGSPDPTPGGGTASAIGGGMGVCLLMMVAGLAKSKTNVDQERAALREARATLALSRDRFLALADTDSDAFNQVMAAFRLSKATDEDKAARKQSIQAAFRVATDAPLETLRTAAAAMTQARTVATYGNRSAVSDVRVAIELLEAAAAGATANVEINIVSLDDEAYRKSAASEVLELTNRLVEDAAAARAALVST